MDRTFRPLVLFWPHPWKTPIKITLQAVQDGLHHPEVVRLSQVGSMGSQPSHCSRDLVRSLGPAFAELPAMSSIKVPVVGHKVAEPLELKLEVQFPHDVFAHYSKHPQEFQQIFGTDEELQAFWGEKNCQDPAFRNHPALSKPDYRTKCVPLQLHSDAVVMSKTESLHVISWSSYFGQGQILESQLLYAAIVKSACTVDAEGRETYKEIYRCLRWSLAACFSGIHPAENWDGEPWPIGSKRATLANRPLNPEGKYMAIFQVLGDLDEICNQYGLHHFNSGHPCFWCRADTEGVPWTDLSPEAAWRDTLEAPSIHSAPPSDHDLWLLPGLSVWSVAWDILHGCDQGPCLHVLGNILEDFMALPELGGTLEQRLTRVWETSQELYNQAEERNRLPYLALSSFRHPGDFPRLRAKANEARHYLPIVLQMLQLFDPARTSYQRTRLRMVRALVDFYNIVSVPKVLLNMEEATQGRNAIMQFLREYSWLAHRALQNGEVRWQLTIKFHYLCHAADLLQYYNPKFASTYPGESFVGKISRIAQSSMMGKPGYAVGGLLMQKIQASRAVRARKELQWGATIPWNWFSSQIENK